MSFKKQHDQIWSFLLKDPLDYFMNSWPREQEWVWGVTETPEKLEALV